MDYPWAERLGELAREHDLALSVHAPLFGWVGHLEASGRKWSSALGALDRSAGIATRMRRRGRRLPPRVPARPQPRGLDRRGRRAARARARAARGEGSGGAVRDRGHGTRQRLRLARGVRRDQPTRRLGAARRRLRAHARDERRRLPRGRAVPRGAELADGVLPTGRRSTSTSPTSRSRTGTRRSTCRTARERSGPTRCARPSPGSTGRRRSSRSRRTRRRVR